MRMIFATQHILRLCMEDMEKVPNRMFKEELTRFIFMNNERLREPHTGFIFRTEFYGTYSKGQKPARLVKELEEAFIDLLCKHNNEINSLAGIKHFLISSMNFTVIAEDLYEIFPRGFHQYIEGYSKEAPANATRMDRDVLEKFIQSKQPYITRINETLALNLLIE